MIHDHGPDVTIALDGGEVVAPAGSWLVDALDDAGRGVPHVCYHRDLGPIRTCDTCLVEVDGRLVRACETPVDAGQQVATATPRAVAARADAVQHLIAEHNLYCTICDNNHGGCELHEAVEAAAVAHQREDFRPHPDGIDATNPFYRYDPDQCIACGRCVEACQNVQVTETLSIDWDADRPRVLWDGGVEIAESSCVSCGHCVTVCPCNALMEKSMLGQAGMFTGLPQAVREPSIDLVKAVEPATGLLPLFTLSEVEERLREQDVTRTKTVCTWCGVGCAFEVWSRDRTILKIQPTGEGPANAISTCVKGKFGWDHVTSEQRLTTPLVRDGDRFRTASWDEALDLVARRLAEVRETHGPDAVGVIGSSKCTNEESYLTQKLARAVIGTNNVDNCSRYCQAPATQGLWRTVGYGGDAGSISDIELADLVIVVGSNTCASHPVLATRIKRSQKLRGQQVIVADLRRHELAERADVFLHPEPGTDLIWLSAVTRHILDAGLADDEFLAEVDGLDEYRDSLAPFTLEAAAERCEIPREVLVDVAERVAAADAVCGLWAMGVTQHTMGSDTSTAISNLLLVTGNYGRPGTGGYPLRGHNNVQGASDFGSITTFLPGYQEVADPEIRARFEAAWGVQLSDRPGLDNHEMVAAIERGDLRAMYVIGEDMGLVDADGNRVEAALAEIDFLVVQDLFHSRTAQFADVVLPAAPSLEKEGTFTNTERRIQRLEPAFAPLPGSRPDWEILVDLAGRMGHRWAYETPAQIMDEVAALTPMFAGVSYDRLRGYDSLQWPVAADGTDTPLLYTDGFAFENGRARLYALQWREPTDQVDDTYDLHLNNGRLLEHFHEGNMSRRTAGLDRLVGETFVEMSPGTAQARGIGPGDRVRVVSRRGSVVVPVEVTDRVADGELYLPMHSTSTDSAVNRLTSSEVDDASDTPAFKEVAVRVEQLDDGEPRRRRGSPLGRTWRDGSPTPQDGVQVERKWARPDYVDPTDPAPGATDPAPGATDPAPGATDPAPGATR